MAKIVTIISVILAILLITWMGTQVQETDKCKLDCFKDCMPEDVNATQTCTKLCEEKSICIFGRYLTRWA